MIGRKHINGDKAVDNLMAAMGAEGQRAGGVHRQVGGTLQEDHGRRQEEGHGVLPQEEGGGTKEPDGITGPQWPLTRPLHNGASNNMGATHTQVREGVIMALR